MNRAAARVAHAAAGDRGRVLGDVGPFGDTTANDLRAAFRDHIAALLEGGADAILVETMSDPAEAGVGVKAAKACDPTIPVIVTYAFQKTAPGEFRTIMGTPATEAMQRAIASGADIVGANCGTALSLDDYVELAKPLVAATEKRRSSSSPTPVRRARKTGG